MPVSLLRNTDCRYFIGSALLLPIPGGEGTAHDLDFIDARVNLEDAIIASDFGVEAANGRSSGALQFLSCLITKGKQSIFTRFTEHYLRGFLHPAFPRSRGIPIGHFADPSHSQGAAIHAKVDLDACYEFPPIWWAVFLYSSIPIQLVHAGCDPGASGRSDLVTCHIRLPTMGLNSHQSVPILKMDIAKNESASRTILCCLPGCPEK